MVASILISRAVSAIPFRIGIFQFFASVLLVASPALVFANTDLPERPTDYLMDNGAVFLPEKAREISDALNACARDYDVHIYVLTLPTLNVMPSRAREKIDGMVDAALSKWFDGKVGAAIIFDSETTFASIGDSEQTGREFSAVQINLIFKDPHLQYRPNVRAADQMERAAMVLVKNFTELRIQEKIEAQRRRKAQFVFGGILGAGLLLGLVVFIVKNRPVTRPDPAATPKTTPHSIA